MTTKVRYGVLCKNCGFREYRVRLARPDVMWRCPKCHDTAQWDGFELRWVEELQDIRTAAEVMAAVVAPLTRCAAKYYMEGMTHAMVIIGSERAGPAARQIFSAAVMREQVDPV